MPLHQHLPASLRNGLRSAQPMVRAFSLWSESGGMNMSAAISFYGILSLAPLLLLLVAVLGWWVDREVLTSGLIHQIGAVVGEKGSAVIQEALHSAKEPSEGLWSALAGLLVLVFGATGVFAELQDAFERLWTHGRPPAPKNRAWRHTLSMRLRGIAYVLVFGFLLLVSLAVAALLSMFSGMIGERFALETLLRALNELAAFGVCGGLFFGLMRLSGGPKPQRRYLMLGAFVGAILYTVGRQVLTIYLSTAAVVSAYGAAGSLIVLLMWIYFSSAVLLFGAACARAMEEAHVVRAATAPPGSPRRRGKLLRPSYRA